MSSAHVFVDYDAASCSLRLTDLASRNGTFTFPEGEPVRLAHRDPLLLGHPAGEFQVGASLRVRATLLEGDASQTMPGSTLCAPIANPTVPYERKPRALVDDALEATILSDVENAAESFERAAAGLHAALASARSINGLRDPDRRDALLRGIAARRPELFSHAGGLGVLPLPDGGDPLGGATLPPACATVAPGGVTSALDSSAVPAERLATLVTCFIEHCLLVLARCTLLSGTHDW